jgi:hypothetical protein
LALFVAPQSLHMIKQLRVADQGVKARRERANNLGSIDRTGLVDRRRTPLLTPSSRLGKAGAYAVR